MPHSPASQAFPTPGSAPKVSPARTPTSQASPSARGFTSQASSSEYGPLFCGRRPAFEAAGPEQSARAAAASNGNAPMTGGVGSTPMAPISAERIQELVREGAARVIELRREIHRLAELSGQEFETSALVRRELDALGIENYLVVEGAGGEVNENGAAGSADESQAPSPDATPACTSVIGVLETGRPGRCVALRADMDALPIAENPCNLAGPRACVSGTGTTSHACGHDGHTAMLLGAARALAHLRDEGQLGGTVILCFEAAEETMSGFPDVLAAIERYPIETIWGIHLYAGLASGRICVDAGPRMSGAADLDVTIHGLGGHGSRPDMARNPTFVAANLLNNLAVAWVNQLAPDTPVTLGPTTISGGQAFNVIPDEARITGSLRYFDEAAGRKALAIVQSVAEHTAAMHGCTATVGGQADLALPVINEPRAAALAKRALADVLPAGAVTACEPWYASESFGHYLRRYPGVFAHVGIANEAAGTGAPHHTPQFDIDEQSLALGVTATLAYATAYLAQGFEKE